MTGQTVARLGLKRVYSSCVHNKPDVIRVISCDNWKLMVELLHMEWAKAADVPTTFEKPTFAAKEANGTTPAEPKAKRQRTN